MKSPTHSMQLLALTVLLLVFPCVARSANQGEQTIPPKTKLSLQLLSPISTATSQQGDKFTCKILTPAEYAGAVVEGHVRSVKRSGRADKESKIDLAFDRVTMLDGSTATFNATVIEVFDVANAGDQGRADNEGTVRNRSKTVKTSIKRAAAGALIGALVGGVVAGGQGAAVGAAIGASIGVTTTLASKGADLEFTTGTQFTVETNGPSKRLTARSAAPVKVAVPSTTFRTFTAAVFTIDVPENWRDSSATPITFAPEGAYKLNNGRPELTHGAMIGMGEVSRGTVQVRSEQFIAAILKSNSYLHKQGNSSNEMIAGRDGVVTVLGGVGSEGYAEVVMVHVTLLSDTKLFYVIAVVPEVELDAYRETFNRVIGSIRFR